MDISSILKNLDQSVLNEETASAIATAFEKAVNEKVEAKTSLQLESALLKQDEEHAEKLQNLIEALDLDHTNNLKNVVEALYDG
jgi:Ca2+-binding EF-hand superfamily protein